MDESDDSDYESDVEADNTGFGAEGTSAEFIARRERQLYKRERKARRKAKTAEEKKKKATEGLQLAMQQGIKIEQRLESGTSIDQLKVAELKALLKARGGSTAGKKDVLRDRLKETDDSGALKLPAMSAMARAEAVAMVVEDGASSDMEGVEESGLEGVEEGGVAAMAVAVVDGWDAAQQEQEQEQEPPRRNRRRMQ